MKKFAKMSLVAAVAVAGFTSANAGSLEEAIKNVEISGNVTYEYKDEKTQTTGAVDSDTQENEYDAELVLKSKINDTVTAVVKFDVGFDNDDADSNGAVNIEDVYFSYAPDYATITLGKQNIPGPWTDGDQGTGLVAMVPAGPVTIAAAYFNNNSVATATRNNIAAVAVLGTVGPVNFEAWYGDVSDLVKSYVVSASADIGPVAVGVSHSYVKEDAANNDKGTITKLEVSGSVDVVNLSASYGFTNDDNDWAVIADGSDAAAGYGSELYDITNEADADMFMIGANVNVTDSVNLGLDYAVGEYDDAANGDTDVQELKFTAKYAMSSNFNIRFFYAVGEEEYGTTDVDTDSGAIEFKYTF